ncbi:hypothetical protein C5167_043550 [Papaver somniferum]|uniref:WPP domain-containing protein n=1 Tax=Papaver somniferum TaxID=3469 RepID=A0A4Y7L8G3_PAPSO|nr:hypothetical protein C5167_043550 [Papaver somniferum]
MEIFSLALEGCGLKTLDLSNNSLGEKGARALTGDEGAVFIAKIVEASPSLEDFCCATSWIGSKGGVALIEAEAGKHLAAALLSNAGLTEVHLAHLNLPAEGAIKVGKALTLTDTGAFFIGDALADGDDQLTEVDMSGNFISKDGATCLARAVAVIFSGSPSMLGPLDENDPNGESEDDEFDEDL